jgi:hypothetical protein
VGCRASGNRIVLSGTTGNGACERFKLSLVDAPAAATTVTPLTTAAQPVCPNCAYGRGEYATRYSAAISSSVKYG